MNKKGQSQDIGTLILWGMGFIVIVVLIGGVFQIIYSSWILPSCPKCETCDYSPYQNNLSLCISNNTNLSKIINETPIRYVNNTIYEYKPIDKVNIIYSWVFVSSSAILVLLLSLKFNLFNLKGLIKIDIDLPNEIKKELDKFKHSVKMAKWVVGIFTALLVIKIILLIWA